MSPTAQNILEEALSLPPLERAGLIERLLTSFDRQSRTAIDTAWGIVAENRIDTYDTGKSETLSLTESRARINNR
jgi:putative addiction module component (TIGR02574 family)